MTFGDIDQFPHNPHIFYPDWLRDEEEEGYDEFTHSQTDNIEDLMPRSEIEDRYGDELRHMADETLLDEPNLLAPEEENDEV